MNILFCFFENYSSDLDTKRLSFLSRYIESVPISIGRPLTLICTILIILDMGISSMALIRSYERQQHIQPHNYIERYLDKKFDDVYLTKRYQNMRTLNENSGL